MAGQFPLWETALHEKNPVLKKVYEGFFKGRLPTPTDFIPRETVDSFGPRSLHLTSTDTPTTRNLNGAAGAYRVKYADRNETVKIIQDALKIDVEQTEVSYVRDPIDLQLTQYGRDLSAHENDLLINGNPDTDDTQPAGLLYRFNNDAAMLGQGVDAANLVPNTNDATRDSFLLLLDEASELCGGGSPDLMVMNRQSWRIFRACLRNRKFLDQNRDQFDRMIQSYNGAKFVNPGKTAATQLSAAAAGQIMLADGTTSIFGTASMSQIIFLATEGDDGIRILQVHGLKTQKVGINPNNTTELVQDMRSTFGLMLPSQFCASILDGINMV